MKAIRHLMQICLLGTVLLALPAVVQAQFTFTNNGDGTCTITGYIGSGGAVTIPSTIDGLTVTSIGSQAFEGSADSPTSVTIPNSVTSIGEGAFEGCPLTSVSIPNSVTNIGEQAFDGTDLTSVTISNSVTIIGLGAFAACNNLTTINVNQSSPNYSVVSGVLFNKNKTTLIQYPGGGAVSYVIPNSVTNIEEIAFGGCSSLTGVTIPSSVTSIGASAFTFCSSLTSITVPNSVTNIGPLRSLTAPV